MAIAQGPGPRLHTQERTCSMVSANPVTRGDICAVDRNTVDATTKEFDTMYQALVANADIEMGMFGVALEDIAAGAEGPFGLRGRFACLTNGAIALKERLSCVTAKDYLDQAVATDKIIAYPLETQTSGENLTLCEFDGINGFGYDHA